MDDENRTEENQASTSKKENDEEMEEDKDAMKRKPEREQDGSSYSMTSGSATTVVTRPEFNVQGYARAAGTGRRDKKKKVRRGRVIKRRSAGKRMRLSRRPAISKRKPKPANSVPPAAGSTEPNNKLYREGSVSTIFSRMSSMSSYDSAMCSFCGHRCCGRRYESEAKRRERKKCVRQILKRLKQARDKEKNTTKESENKKDEKKQEAASNHALDTLYLAGNSAGIQAGSRCKMLSPLLISSNAEDPNSEQPLPGMPYAEITPQMIYVALKHLTMWRQFVIQSSILEFVKSRYPVNSNIDDLQIELSEKLKIAAIVGIVVQSTRNTEDYWCLSADLQLRRLTRNHVSLFWQVYGDTLAPVERRPGMAVHGR